jgi:hypothetical protein
MTVRIPGYVNGDNAIPPSPSSFRNVSVSAKHIRHVENRMRWIREDLVAFLILASLWAIRVKMPTVFCVLGEIRLHQPSGTVDGYPVALLMC